jgi:hypothetical protein
MGRPWRGSAAARLGRASERWDLRGAVQGMPGGCRRRPERGSIWGCWSAVWARRRCGDRAGTFCRAWAPRRGAAGGRQKAVEATGLAAPSPSRGGGGWREVQSKSKSRSAQSDLALDGCGLRGAAVHSVESSEPLRPPQAVPTGRGWLGTRKAVTCRRAGPCSTVWRRTCPGPSRAQPGGGRALLLLPVALAAWAPPCTARAARWPDRPTSPST